MTDLDRFRNIERPREDADGERAPATADVAGFGHIEPRRTAPAPGQRDPFAPPAEQDALALELSPDDVRAVNAEKAAREAERKEELATYAVTQVARAEGKTWPKPVQEPTMPNFGDWFVERLVHRRRFQTAVGVVLTLVVLAAQALGPIVYGLVPALLIPVVVYFLKSR